MKIKQLIEKSMKDIDNEKYSTKSLVRKCNKLQEELDELKTIINNNHNNAKKILTFKNTFNGITADIYADVKYGTISLKYVNKTAYTIEGWSNMSVIDIATGQEISAYDLLQQLTLERK